MPAQRARTSKKREMLSPLPGGLQIQSGGRGVGSTDLAPARVVTDALLNRAESIAESRESDRAQLEAEVAVFCKPVAVIAGGRPSSLSRETLHRLVQHIRADLLAMRQGTTLEFEIPAVTFVCTPDGKSTFIGAVEAIFLLAIAKLMQSEHARIKTCARSGCQNFFARRKRGLYCSRHCAQIKHLAVYVARHLPP